MTEAEWLSSTDPAAMYAFVRDRVTERQMRFFVEACRRLCVEWQYVGVDHHYKTAFNSWCTGLLHRSPILDVRADLLREIIGNPFRPMVFGAIGSKCNHSFVPNPNGEDRCRFVVSDDGNWGLFHCDKPLLSHSSILDPAWLTWNNSTVPNLIRSMMEEECHECYGSGYQVRVTGRGEHSDCEQESCDFCDGKGYVPRAEPQWDMMAIIADALEEAGCTEAAILDHLRGTEPCPHCEGNGKIWGDPRTGVFEAAPTYKCRHCNGTGKRPVRHVRGCWVIELLKE